MSDWNQHLSGSAGSALALDGWQGLECPSLGFDRAGLVKVSAYAAAALWSIVSWTVLAKLSAYLIP